MSARDDLYAYATVSFKDTGVPPVVHDHMTKLINARDAEVVHQVIQRLHEAGYIGPAQYLRDIAHRLPGAEKQ